MANNLGFLCGAGCGTTITADNAGTYRDYCDKCSAHKIKISQLRTGSDRLSTILNSKEKQTEFHRAVDDIANDDQNKKMRLAALRSVSVNRFDWLNRKLPWPPE